MDGTPLEAITSFIDDSERGGLLRRVWNDLCYSHPSGSDIDDTRADL